MGRKKTRTREVALTRVKKKTREDKDKIITNVHEAVQNYKNAYTFSVRDQRSGHVREARELLKPGRMFFGKNKVIGVALGKTESTELKAGLHKLSTMLSGTKGIIFSDQSPEEMKQFFEKFSVPEYAKADFVPREDFVLPAGFKALADFPHSMEAYFRKLEMPTQLVNGKIELIKAHRVAKKGVPLTSMQANIIKLFKMKLDEFKLYLESHWSAETGELDTYLEEEMS
eukprot:Trichotokara_eunicae@DN5426_c0_g1_i3.p1